MTVCPCGSGSVFDECCGPFLAGIAQAPTAEALMRSRYTAFARGDMDYIDRTHAPEKQAAVPSIPDVSIEWLGLEIYSTARGGQDDNTGTVDFAARYRRNGVAGVLRERSTFRREDGRWIYVDGKIAPDPAPMRAAKAGRNDLCPCGSGKKFKKCCGR